MTSGSKKQAYQHGLKLQLLESIIDQGRRSVSNEVRIASIAAKVHANNQEDLDLTELLALARDRWNSSTAYSWRPEIANTLAQGWQQSSSLKQKCIASAHHHFVNAGLMDRDIALFVLLKGFPQDDEVADVIANLLRERFSSFGHESVWHLLPISFRDHPSVVSALDEWVTKEDRHDPIALHYAALAGRTRTMKEKLFEALYQWVPFWATGSLLQGWGMSDPEVHDRLLERVARNDAAEVGQFIPEILNETSEARGRLLSLLRDPVSRRIDFLMRGFARLAPLEGQAEIVDAALDRLGEPTSWTMENYRGAVIVTFPDDDRVKQLARESLASQDPPLSAVAEAYASDEIFRFAIGELITPLPASLRYQIVSDLPISSESTFALEVLKGWDAERNAEVKTQASIQYHSLLLSNDVKNADAVKVLDNMLPCYGPDHEERRQAAAAGLIVLGHLLMVKGKVESVGHVGRQVNIPVTDGLRKNRVFLNLLGTHWTYVKQVLNDKLEILTQDIGPKDLWQNLSTVAAEHAALAKDILEVADTDRELRRSATFLMLISRLEPRSERLSHLCLAAIGDSSQRHDWFDSTETAAVLLAEQFHGDDRTEERLAALASPDHLRTGIVMALSLGWRNNELLQRSDVDPRDRTMDAGYLYAKYACIPASQLGAALEADLILAQQNPFHVNNVIRPVVARLRDDPEAVRDLSTMLYVSPNPSIKASFSKILALSGSFTIDRDKWSREEIARQASCTSPEVGYDLVAKMPRAVTLFSSSPLGKHHS